MIPWEKQQREHKVIEGNINFPQRWCAMSRDGDYREIPFLLGDPMSGPMARILSFPPGRESVRVNGKAYAHHHRTDTFRVALGPQPMQTRILGEWLDHGDFVLRGANDNYVEKSGGRGAILLLVSADRRGYHPVYSDADREDAESTLDETASLVFGDNMPHFHQRDEDAILGPEASFAGLQTQQPVLFGSMPDDETWHKLSDGSKVGAVFMADPVSGTLILLSNNTPNAMESPAGQYQTDMVRLVLSGSCSVGDRAYSAGDFRFTSQGNDEGEIVHGPTGSTQILIFGDRRGWLPQMANGSALEACPRLTELAAMLEPFMAAPAHQNTTTLKGAIA
ncbi:hypothetical protein LP417_32730 (plasmid) [Polaromonas sp. P1-6]|nr:hypothetical protein LP417_32730 [Polaromonas sp. P1-6]